MKLYLLIFPLSILIFPTAVRPQTWISNGCRADYGPIRPTDADIAASLIPTLQLNPHLTVVKHSGRPVVSIPNVTYPIIFHHQGALIDLVQLQGPDRPEASLEENALFVWPAARRAAEDVMTRCVNGVYGIWGGWVVFDVAGDGNRTRRFELRVRGRSVQRMVWILRHWRRKGFMVWPRVPGLFEKGMHYSRLSAVWDRANALGNG